MSVGLQSHKKSFSVGPATLVDRNGSALSSGSSLEERFPGINRNVCSDADHQKYAKEAEEIEKKLRQARVEASPVKTKKIIPYGNRIIVKRRKIEKAGSGIIELPTEVSERLTELAEIVALPELTFVDKQLMENSESIINSYSDKAMAGDTQALKSLLEFNEYLKIKTLKVGDVIMLSRYNSVEFTVGETNEQLSITDPEGIRGLVVEKK